MTIRINSRESKVIYIYSLDMFKVACVYFHESIALRIKFYKLRVFLVYFYLFPGSKHTTVSHPMNPKCTTFYQSRTEYPVTIHYKWDIALKR